MRFPGGHIISGDERGGSSTSPLTELLKLSERLDSLEGWAAGIIQNEHRFIQKDPDVEFDPKTGKLSNTLQEQINELRLMVEALAKNVKGLNRTEEMKWKDAYSRLIAGTFDNGPRNANPNSGHGHVFPRPDGVIARCGGPSICAECALDKVRADNAEV